MSITAVTVVIAAAASTSMAMIVLVIAEVGVDLAITAPSRGVSDWRTIVAPGRGLSRALRKRHYCCSYGIVAGILFRLLCLVQSNRTILRKRNNTTTTKLMLTDNTNNRR